MNIESNKKKLELPPDKEQAQYNQAVKGFMTSLMCGFLSIPLSVFFIYGTIGTFIGAIIGFFICLFALPTYAYNIRKKYIFLSVCTISSVAQVFFAINATLQIIGFITLIVNSLK